MFANLIAGDGLGFAQEKAFSLLHLFLKWLHAFWFVSDWLIK